MEDKKAASYKSIAAILNNYHSASSKKEDTLITHCARLEALEYLLPALQQCLSDWDMQPLEISQKLVVKILSEVRERTKRTSLSLFENPHLPENQLVIDLAHFLEESEKKSAIELLCPDLSVNSAHDKYRDLVDIPLEELFGTFIESSHDGYVVPVNVLSEIDMLGVEQMTLPNNYYYDYLKENPLELDTTKLTPQDLSKLFEHSADTEKLQQLQQEYWIVQQQDPSLYANLNLFVKRLKKESVNERGSELDTGAGAYQLIIDFFEYYDALSPADKDLVPAQVKEQLRLIHAYSSDPQMNLNALGEQEVQTCTATRSKELEKAIQSPENSNILKTIAVSSQARTAELEAIETEVRALKKTIESKDYRGKPAPGRLASLIAREKWTFSEVFPEGSNVDAIHFLSAADIRELFSKPNGFFATDIRNELTSFFYNEKVIDIVLALNNSQKIALCASLQDLIVPGISNYQKLSYLIQLIGGDNLEKALGTEIKTVLLEAKNAIISQRTFAVKGDRSWQRYGQLSKMLMQSNMSAEMKKQLDISEEDLKKSLENHRQNEFVAKLLEIASLPLPRAAIKNLVIYASSQPEFYKQLDSFQDLVALFSEAQLDTETKKNILQNFFHNTPPKDRNFYMGLADQAYDVVLRQSELTALIPSAILDTISYNFSWKSWLQQDKELGYPMSRGLLNSLEACSKFNRMFSKEHAAKMLACADPEQWTGKRPKLKDLNLRDSFELCQLLQHPRIEKYIFSGKRAATFIKDALELDKMTYSQPFRRLLMSPHGAVVLTHLNSFIKLRIVLSSADPLLSQKLFTNLAAEHMDFLKQIAATENDDKQVLSWLKQTSLLYRIGLGFLEPAIGYLFGATRVQQWAKHMTTQAAERLSKQSTAQQTQTPQKESAQEYDLGPSSQSALCFSQSESVVRQLVKNKK